MEQQQKLSEKYMPVLLVLYFEVFKAPLAASHEKRKIMSYNYYLFKFLFFYISFCISNYNFLTNF